jgi:hypothetical protein
MVIVAIKHRCLLLNKKFGVIMKKILTVPFALCVVALVGCSTAQTPAGNTVDISKVDFTNATKVEACETYFLNFGPLGEERASPVEASKKAGFKEVVAVDYVEHSYFIGRKRCAVVYGKM